jgi:hypothetical protein
MPAIATLAGDAATSGRLRTISCRPQGGTPYYEEAAWQSVLDGGGKVDSGSVTKQWTYGNSDNLLWAFTAL